MARLTQKEMVSQYMQENGSITTWEAFEKLGFTRLSEYIRQLRIDYNIADEWIQTINRYGEKVKFKKWYCGHYHKNDNYTFDNYECLYDNIKEIK